MDVWSLGVVLYICLCGFPPFSDELYSAENPYTLSQQIKMGRFDYPSPYWDPVGDPALDLIDRMLEVNADKRISIDECLEHPWTTAQPISLTDSTDGLTGALAGLDFAKRKPMRERTLLSSINDVKIERVIETPESGNGTTNGSQQPVTVFEKNSGKKLKGTPKKAGGRRGEGVGAGGGKKEGHVENTVVPEPGPDAERDPGEFIEMGGKGDQVLFEAGEGDRSLYPEDTMVKAGAPERMGTQ